MHSNTTMIHKLQQAINEHGGQLIYNKNQFWSDKQNRPVTLYSIKTTLYNEKTGRNSYKELFSATSQIQIVLFLRDYWYQINGWEIPTDNQMWNSAKDHYKQRQAKRKDKVLNEDEDNGWAEYRESEIKKPKALEEKEK